eukprot:2190755-Pyramimonas_sp.AAC.1
MTLGDEAPPETSLDTSLGGPIGKGFPLETSPQVTQRRGFRLRLPPYSVQKSQKMRTVTGSR